MLGKHSLKICGPGKTVSMGLEGTLDVIDEEQVLLEGDRLDRLRRLEGLEEEAIEGQVEDMDIDVDREALVEGQGQSTGEFNNKGS